MPGRALSSLWSVSKPGPALPSPPPKLPFWAAPGEQSCLEEWPPRHPLTPTLRTVYKSLQVTKPTSNVVPVCRVLPSLCGSWRRSAESSTGAPAPGEDTAVGAGSSQVSPRSPGRLLLSPDVRSDVHFRLRRGGFRGRSLLRGLWWGDKGC